MLTTIVILVHVAVALALIMIILLQTGKGAGMGAAFGGSSQTLFGSTGRATFLTKVTIVAAVIFGFTSLGLSFIWTGGESVMDDYRAPEQQAPQMPELPEIPEIPGAAGAEETGTPGALLPEETRPTEPEPGTLDEPLPELPGMAPPALESGKPPQEE